VAPAEGPIPGFVPLDATVTDVRVLSFAGKPDDPTTTPLPNMIPLGASIVVEFQGASELVPGSGVVDPSDVSPWSMDVSTLDGRPFFRYRVTFELASHPSGALAFDAPRPAIDWLRLRFRIE
jgi:hypothetical protein